MKHEPARILIVEDERDVGELLARWLTSEGHTCLTASNGEEALGLLNQGSYDLIITDIMMPGMSGVDLLTIVKPLFRHLAVLMVTAVDDRQTAITALELGAYGYIIKPFNRHDILINVANALERRRLVMLSEEHERSLEAQVALRTREVEEREEEIILRLISAMGHRDDETGAHIRRVGLLSYEMALGMGWNLESANRIRRAAPMHDLGKIGIPDAILLKRGKLSPEEFEIMTKHTEIGAAIFDGSTIPLLQMARDIALYHHERWDGYGYPRGLIGEEIPESARIVSIVDAYDVLLSNSVHRTAYPEEKAVFIISTGVGSVFDPEVYKCFMRIQGTLRRVRAEIDDRESPVSYLRDWVRDMNCRVSCDQEGAETKTDA